MNANRIVSLLLIIAAILIWLFNGYIFATLFTGGAVRKPIPFAEESRGFVATAALADSALKTAPKIAGPAFTGQFENPFKTPAEAFAPPAQKTVKASPESQVKLTLKGVLLKKQPLAILEDETGKTYICGKDETIKGQLVERIEATGVTLRNSLGSYTLIVKE